MQYPPVSNLSISLPTRKLASFCRRRMISELAVFGSALRSDFKADSDIDLLVTFAPQATWNAFDLIRMQEELEGIIGRPVDLVERDTIRNPFRRRTILGSAQVIYAAE